MLFAVAVSQGGGVVDAENNTGLRLALPTARTNYGSVDNAILDYFGALNPIDIEQDEEDVLVNIDLSYTHKLQDGAHQDTREMSIV